MPKTKLKLKTYRHPIASVHKLLQKRLRAYNHSKVGRYETKHLLLAYYKHNRLIAGLYGIQHFGTFYISLLWVDNNYQQQGLGSKLLKTAEQFATKNKSLYIAVNTASFQAPKFYLKNGYKQFAKLPLTTPNKQKHSNYYFIKLLQKIPTRKNLRVKSRP